jgi:hypothetical protein
MFANKQLSKNELFELLGLEKIMGMNKKQVVDIIGLHFNDINSDFWMYHISNLTIKKSSQIYLYLIFNNNILMEVKFSRIKKILFLESLKNLISI